MSRVVVVLDLDGPLLEGRDRHWECYRQVLQGYGHEPLPQEDYWRLKRTGADRLVQLAASGAESIYDQFLEGWLGLIETPELLSLDRLQPGVLDVLDRWRDAGLYLVLATHRRDPVALRDQLLSLGLGSRLDRVLPSPPGGGAQGKAAAVTDALRGEAARVCAWIGDTPVDHAAARILGCAAWIVTCGVRDASVFESLDCEIIAACLEALPLPRLRPHSN
jgi:phosphoglycolate phosphatase